MKILIRITFLLTFAGCGNSFNLATDATVSSGLVAGKICAGEVIGDVTGTANCSSGGESDLTDSLYVLAARNDISSVGDWSAPLFLTDLIDKTIDRSDGVLTLKEVSLSSFASKYQAIPNVVTDTDGRHSNVGGIAKKHYLERIVGRPDKECGTSGTVSQRVSLCRQENGAKAFYDGRQYGQAGEGDWSLVTRLSSGEEVWRDERTKLLWSDKTSITYQWFHASGYAKLTATSVAETSYNSQPGVGTACRDHLSVQIPCQSLNPISLCAEVDDDGVVVGGGADPLYDESYTPTSDASIEKDFKGSLGVTQDVLWKLPSIDDWKMADVNGLRKVLRTTDSLYWSSTTNSQTRSNVWIYSEDTGLIYNTGGSRSGGSTIFVRCVGLALN